MDVGPKKQLLQFLAEDIQSGDITSALLPNKKIKAKIISREQGIVAGVKFARYIFQSKRCAVRIFIKDGSKLKPNQTILQVSGSAKSILTCERTVLNLLSSMSGIATQTNYLVSQIKKYSKKTNLYSTRKTAPGLRYFDKEAVKIGGGHKHRMELDDMVMIKDNHLLVCGRSRKSKGCYICSRMWRYNYHAGQLFTNTDQKTITTLQKKKLRNRVKLEASGGINSKNINAYAKTGVDIISIGSITNSVKGLDLSLEVSSPPKK